MIQRRLLFVCAMSDPDARHKALAKRLPFVARAAVIITALVMDCDPMSLVDILRGKPWRSKNVIRVRKLLLYVLSVELGNSPRHTAASLGYVNHTSVQRAQAEVEQWRSDPYVDDAITDLAEGMKHIILFMDAYQKTGSIDDPEQALRAIGRYMREARVDEYKRLEVA